MTINTIDFSELKENIIQDPAGAFYIVALNPPKYLQFENTQICSALAPRPNLYSELKYELIEPDEFERRYYNHLTKNPLTVQLITYLIHQAKTQNIYLTCDSKIESQKAILMKAFDATYQSMRPQKYS